MADQNTLFAQATDWLAKHGVAAIDWEALAAQRKNSVRNTAYMYEYILPAFERARAVIDTLDLPRRPPDDVLHAYSVLSSEAATFGEKALEIAKINAQITKTMLFPADNAAFAARVQVGIYGMWIYHLWSAALTGANAHLSAQIHKSGIDDADIAYHASLVTMCLNLIAQLDRWQLLSPLKKRPASGLGLTPLAVGLIIIGSVGAVAIVWGLIAIYQLSLRQKIVEQVCAKAIESGDPTETKRCDDLLNNPEANLASQVPKAAGALIEKVAIAAMVGAGIYVLVLFGPGIASQLKKTVSSWKAA